MFTILVDNTLLRSARYQGKYETLDEAVTRAAQQAARSQPFVTYQIWSGTPSNPGKPVKGIRKRSSKTRFGKGPRATILRKRPRD